MHGRHNVHFEVQFHGRKKFLLRSQVVHLSLKAITVEEKLKKLIYQHSFNHINLNLCQKKPQRVFLKAKQAA